MLRSTTVAHLRGDLHHGVQQDGSLICANGSPLTTRYIQYEESYRHIGIFVYRRLFQPILHGWQFGIRGTIQTGPYVQIELRVGDFDARFSQCPMNPGVHFVDNVEPPLHG